MWVSGGEFRQRFIQRHQVLAHFRLGNIPGCVKVKVRQTAAMPLSTFAPGIVDENAAHGLGRGGKEMTAMIPLIPMSFSHQAKIRFMNQRRRLQSLTPFVKP